MEVIEGWTHRCFEIADASCVGEARRHLVGLASARHWPAVDAERAVIVITELGTNLAKHASSGKLLVAARDPAGDLEVISVDKGPGMADVGRFMRDGFSTASSPGNGLGAIVRQSDFFDLHSSVPAGTVCVARLRPRGPGSSSVGRVPERTAPFEFGAVCVPVQGESLSGDGWAIVLDGEQAAAIVADGLGHGPDAAVASGAAVRAFCSGAFRAPEVSLRQVHEELRTTRGAAVLALWLQGSELRHAGAGNVMGRLVSGTLDKSLITPHGTMGLQARRFDAVATSLPKHVTTIVHSDGIQSRWQASGLASLLGKDPVLLAARVMADNSRGRDDVCVLAMRSKEYA